MGGKSFESVFNKTIPQPLAMAMVEGLFRLLTHIK